MKKIMLIEDSIDFQDLMKITLGHDYLVATAETTQAALELLKHESFDMIFLDLMLPDGDGFKLFSQLRNDPNTKDIPIVFISARTGDEDIIMAFTLGADDYITKPINPKIFRAKISSLLTKHAVAEEAAKLITRHNLQFDLSSQQVYKLENGLKIPIELTQIEYKLLLKLAEHPSQVYSREQLINAIWGQGIYINDRCIDNHISKIRKKLNNQFIRSIRSRGYSFSEENEESAHLKAA